MSIHCQRQPSVSRSHRPRLEEDGTLCEPLDWALLRAQPVLGRDARSEEVDGATKMEKSGGADGEGGKDSWAGGRV